MDGFSVGIVELFGIFNSVVMGAKGLLILLDPTSTGFYLPGQCVSGVVALDSRNVSYKGRKTSKELLQ